MTSCVQVCGFIATIRSTPPRRPICPASDTRTSYQVGRPWMFDGKMLREATGTPMRRMERANSRFADADPEPLTFANLTTKSLTRFTLVTAIAGMGAFIAVTRSSIAPAAARRVRHVEQEFLHIPCAGRAALGTKTAMQAEVLVLRHDPARLQGTRDVKILRQVSSRYVQPGAEVCFLAVLGERDAVEGTDVDAGVALDAERRREYRLHVAIQTALRFLVADQPIEPELDL